MIWVETSSALLSSLKADLPWSFKLAQIATYNLSLIVTYNHSEVHEWEVERLAQFTLMLIK